MSEKARNIASCHLYMLRSTFRNVEGLVVMLLNVWTETCKDDKKRCFWPFLSDINKNINM